MISFLDGLHIIFELPMFGGAFLGWSEVYREYIRNAVTCFPTLLLDLQKRRIIETRQVSETTFEEGLSVLEGTNP